MDLMLKGKVALVTGQQEYASHRIGLAQEGMDLV